MTAILFLSTLILATLISCKEEKIKKVQNQTPTAVGLSADSLKYVGRDVCRDCHQTEYSLWQNSHHDLAMQAANANTVLGDFSNASVTIFGVTSKFYKKEETFYVETEGQDGDLHEYEIAYTLVFLRYNSIWLIFRPAGCRYYRFAGIHVREKRAASAGFIYIPMSR